MKIQTVISLVIFVFANVGMADQLELFERQAKGKKTEANITMLEFRKIETVKEEVYFSKVCFTKKKTPQCQAVAQFAKKVDVPAQEELDKTISPDSSKCQLTGGETYILIDEKLNEYETCRYKDSSSFVRSKKNDDNSADPL